MPIISIFYGIAVSMYFGDHPPPHIHIECQGYEALVRISDGSRGERISAVWSRRTDLF